MPVKLPTSLALQRADHRAEFDRARGALKAALKDLPRDAAIAAVIELGAVLDAAVGRLKRDLLGSTLCWNDDHHALGTWIHQQHRRLADAALKLAEQGDASDLRITGWLLQHEAEALKWNAGRERPDYARLNALFARACEAGVADLEVACMADGRGYRVALEPMYLRLLLLDRLGTGVLTRQQVEVLDAWLREGCGSLRLCATPVEGAALSLDLAGDAGLRAAGATPAASSRWLALAPLEAHRRHIVRELQAGRLVPAYGCTAEFRLEEHVAVLHHLRVAIATCAGAVTGREARDSAPGTRIEAWVGIAEIFARAAATAAGVETGQFRSLAASEAGAANQPIEALDPQRRYLWLVDASAAGCGFEALEQDAAGIDIGDLVGWRRAGAIAVGRVARRVAGKSPGQVFVGVRLLADAALPLALRRVDASAGGEAAADYLFIPGDDASGRRDAILVPENVFSPERAYRARVGDESFTFRLNRVRGRGRGWILAGFEIVPQRTGSLPAATREALDVLDFTLAAPMQAANAESAGAEDIDPWSHEVPLRLLD